MPKAPVIFAAVILVGGCARQEAEPEAPDRDSVMPVTLREARDGFRSQLIARGFVPVDFPKVEPFQVIDFDSPVGSLPALITADPGDAKPRPAVVWLGDGDCNSIGDVRAAGPLVEAGLVVMIPSLRGGNRNPGVREGFLGEVDDVVAAAGRLAKLRYVDPQRIHLVGHGTGGTLALLTAQCCERFRYVFAFGPVDDPARYGPHTLPFDVASAREREPRSPIHWLDSIKTPVYVIEGRDEPSEIESLDAMAAANKNLRVRFLGVRGANRRTVVAPAARVIAERILRDTGRLGDIALTERELDALFAR